MTDPQRGPQPISAAVTVKVTALGGALQAEVLAYNGYPQNVFPEVLAQRSFEDKGEFYHSRMSQLLTHAIIAASDAMEPLVQA
jgi:hypothetical protein